MSTRKRPQPKLMRGREHNPNTPPRRRSNSLTERQRAFCHGIVAGKTAKQAAVDGGYSEQTAEKQTFALLGNARVAEYLAELREQVAERAKVTADRVIEEVDTVLLGEIGDVLDFSGEQVSLRPANQITEKGRRLLSSVKVRRTFEKGPGGLEPVEVLEFKLWDKAAFARLAMQYRGMLTEKVEHTGKDGQPIAVEHAVRVYLPSNGRDAIPEGQAAPLALLPTGTDP